LKTEYAKLRQLIPEKSPIFSAGRIGRLCALKPDDFQRFILHLGTERIPKRNSGQDERF
jgi:hypothetical protein